MDTTDDAEQWVYYGMLACLLNECEDEHAWASNMSVQADFAYRLEVFEDGDDEMYAWLARTQNPGDRDKTKRRLT